MSSNALFQNLVEKLETATSLPQQLGILAGNIEVVRNLRPEERYALATRLGVSNAMPLIERLIRNSRFAPLLLRAARKAEAAEPEELHRILQILQQTQGPVPPPPKRQAAKNFEVRPAIQTPAEPPPPPVTPEESVPAPQVPVPPSSGETHGDRKTSPAAPAGQEIGGVEDGTEPVELLEDRETTEAALPSKPEKPTGGDGVERPPVPIPVTPSAAADLKPPPSPRLFEPEPSSPEESATGSRVHLDEGTTQRGNPLSVMRRVRQQARQAVSIEVAEETLREIPEGWLRRRAMCLFIDAGVFDQCKDPAMLFEGVRPSDELWVLSAILRRPVLAERIPGRLSDRLESPLARRRLRFWSTRADFMAATLPK